MQPLPPKRRHIRKLLLAGNPYDGFILEEAGFRASGEDGPEDAPTFDLVRSGARALEALDSNAGYDMVLADYTLPDMSGPELADRIKERNKDFPVAVLTSNTDLGGATGRGAPQQDTNLFIWYGAPSLVRALVKLQEDELNAPLVLGPLYSLVILLVEDEPNFYSHFVPVLYERIRESAIELVPRTRRPPSPWSIIENRPLVLLRRNFEEACEVLYKYRERLMALVTDIRFPVKGELKGDAGLRLLYRARSIDAHLPVAVHSREREHQDAVAEAKGRFLWKDSPRLLAHLDHFLIHSCGFGPFVFRWPAGERYGVARSLRELRVLTEEVPDVVFEYHALHHDFSTWLVVHGYRQLAQEVRELSITAFDPRQDILRLFDRELAAQQDP